MPQPDPSAGPYGIGGSLLGERLRAVATAKVLHRGDTFVHEGDPPSVLGVVIEGRVKIVTHAASGKDVILHVLGPGQVFGVVPVLDLQPYPASVVAVDETVTIGRVDAARFEAVLRADGELALVLLRSFAGRMRTMSVTVSDAQTGDAESRLAARLLGQAGGGQVVAITRQELADLSGTTVETAIRVTRAWEREGLVRLSRGRIEIVDRDEIAARSGHE